MNEYKEYNGYVYEIKQDEDAWSPREGDNFGTFVTALRRYNSPDDINELFSISSYVGFLLNIADDIGVGNIERLEKRYYNNDLSKDDVLKSIEKKAIILPVYVYEHGNIAYSTTPFSCKWDSSIAGYIYVSFDNVKERFNCKRLSKNIIEKATNILIEEVIEYSQWASGDVYTYYIYKKEDLYDDFPIECLSGIYGYNEAIEYCKKVIDDMVLNDRKDHMNKLKSLIQNRVPLNKRLEILNTI